MRISGIPLHVDRRKDLWSIFVLSTGFYLLGLAAPDITSFPCRIDALPPHFLILDHGKLFTFSFVESLDPPRLILDSCCARMFRINTQGFLVASQQTQFSIAFKNTTTSHIPHRRHQHAWQTYLFVFGHCGPAPDCH
jgi:hypothetical protein